jgi:two-component system LytT family response regulator
MISDFRFEISDLPAVSPAFKSEIAHPKSEISLHLTKPEPMEPKLIKTIVVDDEKPSRDGLSTFIRDFCRDVSVIAECDSVKTAYTAIMEHKPDLVFLDIEMPNGSGFDLLKLYKTPPFKVIFITAFSEYAIRAFRFSAADYLLKPVKVDELVEAVDKVRAALNNKVDNLDILTLNENLASKTAPENLVINDIRGFTVIKVRNIIKCEGEGYCTHFHLKGGRKLTSSRNLKYYEELMAENQILRVHHSSLVNLDHVEGYSRQGEIFLTEGLKCSLGDKYKTGFMERFRKGK